MSSCAAVLSRLVLSASCPLPVEVLSAGPKCPPQETSLLRWSATAMPSSTSRSFDVRCSGRTRQLRASECTSLGVHVAEGFSEQCRRTGQLQLDLLCGTPVKDAATSAGPMAPGAQTRILVSFQQNAQTLRQDIRDSGANLSAKMEVNTCGRLSCQITAADATGSLIMMVDVKPGYWIPPEALGRWSVC